MDYLDFLFCLKGVAIRTGLRLFHNIPPAGCGWMGAYAYIDWNIRREDLA